MNNSFFPWFENYLDFFNNDNLVHAHLISGKKGIGKYSFTKLLAKSILCLSSEELFKPCDNCNSCKTLESKSNPDFYEVCPENEGGMIKIGQLRGDSKKDGDEKGIIKLAFESPLLCKAKVIIINEADSMNMESQNLILKTLEEPPKNTYIFLVSSKPFSLKATLLSRLNHTLIAEPSTESLENWIKKKNIVFKNEDIQILKYLNLNNLSEDSILDIREKINNFSEDLSNTASAKKIEKIANDWDDEFLSKRLTWFLEVILSSIYLKLDVNHDKPEHFSKNINYLTKEKSLIELFDYSKKINDYLSDLSRGINLNHKIQIKSLLSNY